MVDLLTLVRRSYAGGVKVKANGNGNSNKRGAPTDDLEMSEGDVKRAKV